TERVFRLLGLLHSGEDFVRIFRGLRGIRSSTGKARASARELLENLLGRGELRDKFLVLVDEISDQERLARGAPKANRDGVAYEVVLGEMIESGGDTLRSLVAYHVGEFGMESLRVNVETIRERTNEPVVTKLMEQARALLAAPSKVPVPG